MNSLRTFLAAAVACGLAWPSAALATHGMNPIAFDAHAAGLGGADTALSLSTLSLVRNPASIAFLGTRVDLNLSLTVPSLTLNDEVQGQMVLNTDLASEDAIFPLFGVAFATEVTDGLHLGLGVYAQGGLGADFKGLATFADGDASAALTTNPSPATYDTHSKVQYLRIAPTVAYALSDAVSLGAALHVGLAQMEFSHSGMQFPEADGDHVYVPHAIDFASDWALTLSGSVGLQAALLEGDLRFGTSLVFGAKPAFEGELTLDGQLTYDAKTDDFGWPLGVAFGVAGRVFDDALLLSADFRFDLWSDSVDEVTITGDLSSQGPPDFAKVQLPFVLDWRDRAVLALGAELAVVRDLLAVRLGYAYSPSPVTPSGVNALFPAVTDHHLTLGLGLSNIAGGLTLDLAAEVALANEVTSDATNQMAFEPAMPGATPSANGYRVGDEMSQIAAHVKVGWVF